MEFKRHMNTLPGTMAERTSHLSELADNVLAAKRACDPKYEGKPQQSSNTIDDILDCLVIMQKASARHAEELIAAAPPEVAAQYKAAMAQEAAAQEAAAHTAPAAKALAPAARPAPDSAADSAAVAAAGATPAARGRSVRGRDRSTQGRR